MTDLSRRGALGLLAAALAAPAIIRMPGLLMPILPPHVRLVHHQLWTVHPSTGMAQGGLEAYGAPGERQPMNPPDWDRSLPWPFARGREVMIRGGVPKALGYVSKPGMTYAELVGDQTWTRMM